MNSTAPTAVRLRGSLRPVLRRLLIEQAGALSAGTVIRCVARCHYELHRAGVRAGLPQATEVMARTRLHDLAATHSGATGTPEIVEGRSGRDAGR